MIKVSRGCLGEEELAAVKEAFELGKINTQRYESYLRLLGVKDGRYERRVKGAKRTVSDREFSRKV